MSNFKASKNLLSESFIGLLSTINPRSLKRDVSLATLSRWKVGGNAKCIFSPNSVEELVQVVELANKYAQKYIVIGSTSNLLFADEGLDILAIHIGSALSNVSLRGCEVDIESGAWVPGFAKFLANNDLSGLEHIVGIPGTLGGLIYMNGGSMRRGIGENVLSVNTLTREGHIKKYLQDSCLFGYRTSIFQNNDEIILSATLKLEKAPRKEIKKRMLEILRSRRKKFPQKLPNCGSVFVSNPEMYSEFGPPGSIIEKVGLKGHRKGGASISSLHANFIVNDAEATANDILYLIFEAKSKVKQFTGHNMKAEAIYIEPNGQYISAGVKAEQVWG